jgi:hypothetical protein
MPIKAAKINNKALFPYLSTEIPIKGIRIEEIKKGKAIAIPTL